VRGDEGAEYSDGVLVPAVLPRLLGSGSGSANSSRLVGARPVRPVRPCALPPTEKARTPMRTPRRLGKLGVRFSPGTPRCVRTDVREMVDDGDTDSCVAVVFAEDRESFSFAGTVKGLY